MAQFIKVVWAQTAQAKLRLKVIDTGYGGLWTR